MSLQKKVMSNVQAMYLVRQAPGVEDWVTTNVDDAVCSNCRADDDCNNCKVGVEALLRMLMVVG